MFHKGAIETVGLHITAVLLETYLLSTVLEVSCIINRTI